MFLFEKFNCLFHCQIEDGFVYIDSNGIIQLINKKNSLCRSKYIDEKDIISKIYAYKK